VILLTSFRFVAAQMMSHFYSPLHHMYGSLHAPRYPVDQKYPPPPLLEQKYHQYPAGGNGGEDQTDLRYGATAGEKYPESGDSKMHPCHKPISSPSPSVSQQQQQAAAGGSYADRHFLSSPAAAAGGGLSAPGGEDVKPLDKLQLQQHQLHPHQDKSSESSDYESKDGGGGGGYTPEQAGSGSLYSPGGGGGGYYHQPGNGELVPGGESPDHLAHPAYGGYSTTFGGLANPLVRPRSNKNKTQAGALQKITNSE
jgi:hypothetical protein